MAQSVQGIRLGDSDVESDEEFFQEEEETEEDKRMEDFITAVRNGFIKTVREVLDTEEGVELLQRKDKEGHTPLHWACLGGYNNICELLIEKGCPLNEHSDNDYGPKPIHWACVKGHVVTIDFLIEKGVHIDSTDLNGCSPLIVASQYGQSLVVSYLLQKGANRFHTDVDQDTALHWACYKGYPEVVFLLINAGLDVKQKDSYGQTPMHSCCIKGDLQVAEMLLEQDAKLDEEDSKGNTPRMLARKRRHRRLLQLFEFKDIPTDLWDWRVWVFGPPSRSRYAFVFFILAIILWGYPLYYFVALPYTVEQIPKTHTIFWISNFIMWALFIYLKLVNPGYVPSNNEAYDNAQKMVGDPTSWGEYDDLHNPVYNMCHTCKTVRPIRSKHCRQCDKCVEHFDHHCPWIDNCVSRANRVPFFFFVHSMLLNGVLTYWMVYIVLKGGGGGFIVWAGIVILIFFSVPVVIMLGYTYMLMFLNMTTNERANYKRYRYFRDGHGSFRNPFSRGVFHNILEYFNIIEPVNLRNKAKSYIV